jgi:hypothetical protein
MRLLADVCQVTLSRHSSKKTSRSARQHRPKASLEGVNYAASPQGVALLEREHAFAVALAAEPGAWIHMPPNLPHSIRARTPVTMLLLLLK